MKDGVAAEEVVALVRAPFDGPADPALEDQGGYFVAVPDRRMAGSV